MKNATTSPALCPRPLPSRRFAGGRLAVILAAALVVAGVAGAQETMRFEPIGVFDFEVDGKVVEGARIFHSAQAAAVLVMTPRLPYPIAVVPRNKTVQRLAAADLRDEPHGSVAWTASGTKDAVATFEMVDEKPEFELEGHKIRFLDRPPLLGPKTLEQLIAYDASYRYRAAQAETPTHYMDVLESWPDEVLVKVFFSTQCQVCRELLPNIIKLMDTLDNPKFSYEFYGMPLPAERDPLAVELKIATFPTVILYRDGKEIGRGIGHSWRLPSMALHNTLIGIQLNPETAIQRQ